MVKITCSEKSDFSGSQESQDTTVNSYCLQMKRKANKRRERECDFPTATFKVRIGAGTLFWYQEVHIRGIFNRRGGAAQYGYHPSEKTEETPRFSTLHYPNLPVEGSRAHLRAPPREGRKGEAFASNWEAWE